MGVRDTLHFDKDAYYNEHRNWTLDALKRKHHQKVMLHAARAGGATVSGVAAVVTAGVSLLHTAYSARQMEIVDWQREVLEQILLEHGWKIPRTRKRDVVGGVALAAVTAGLGAVVAEWVSVSDADSIMSEATNGFTEAIPCEDPCDGATYYEFVAVPVSATSTAAALAATHGIAEGGKQAFGWVSSKVTSATLGHLHLPSLHKTNSSTDVTEGFDWEFK